MKKLVPWLVGVCVLTGLVCRVILLNISFEYDEIFSAVSANPAQSLASIWQNYWMADVHPPLYNLLLWLYNHCVPYRQEWMLRWPSVVCGVTALFLSGRLFPAYLGKTARRIFLVLMSCNFYLILYSQHARAYAWLVCLAVPFTFLYLQIMRRTDKRKPAPAEWWAWYGVLGLLLCWSHYFGALLFGLYSVMLVAFACKRKQPLWVFIGVPAGVLVGFLPWLVPNLLENISQQRFAGNWWGNEQQISWHLVRLWVEFFFSSVQAFSVLAAVALGAAVYNFLRLRRGKAWPYRREIGFLLVPMALAGVLVLAASYKIFWLLWRYFMPFVPGLYLWVALLLAPVCKRYKSLFVVLVCFAGLSFYAFGRLYPYFVQGRFFPARSAMKIYKEAFGDKDLYVIALEAFPPQSLNALYGFYPKVYFHTRREVYELAHLPKPAREQLMQNQQNAVIWMPNCGPQKLQKLTHQWGHVLHVFATVQNTCFLIPAEDDSYSIWPGLRSEYTRRYRDYRIRENEKNQRRFISSSTK